MSLYLSVCVQKWFFFCVCNIIFLHFSLEKVCKVVFFHECDEKFWRNFLKNNIFVQVLWILIKNYLKTIIFSTGPGKPFIIADAFKWHLPCKTIPLTFKQFSLRHHFLSFFHSLIKIILPLKFHRPLPNHIVLQPP